MVRAQRPDKDLNSTWFAAFIPGWAGVPNHYYSLQAITPSGAAMIGKLDQALGFHEAALRLRSERQQALASNIANADTPNFKARDFDFGQALQNAVGRTSGTPAAPSANLALTDAGHQGGNGAVTKAGAPSLLYRTGVQGGVDGNTVDMDVERNQFTDNALRYEASITMISSQIKNMLTAIQG
jgi:flagellar basal-body rod protein FlgB